MGVPSVPLTIAVITMNRSKQLSEALQSCLFCHLPKGTEFVIIDNASIDETGKTVETVLGNSGFIYHYEKLSENLGVGRGRNYAYSKSHGEYVYVLDDDAVIDYEYASDFFIKALHVLNSHPEIATLTTQIYDTAWKKDRVVKNGRMIVAEVYSHQMFCGGSHFLRRAFFTQPPYLHNKYGYEEIPPSLRVMNDGMINAFCPELRVIHRPIANKWDWTISENQELLFKGIAAPYAIKSMMFPVAMRPLLWAAVQVRALKSLCGIPNAHRILHDTVRVMRKEYALVEKIKLSTVWKMVMEFGLSAF